MATLKEEAQAYVPPQTKNIADLEKFPVDIELLDGSGTDKDGKEFKYKYVEVEGEKYRVPGSVIGSLKSILKVQPDMKVASVIRDGTGMNTRYQVIPYTEPKVPINEQPIGGKQ